MKEEQRDDFSDFLESVFLKLIQRKYLPNDWKIYHVSALSKPKQRVNLKTWLFVKKNFFIGRNIYVANQCVTKENSPQLQKEVEVKVLTETL